MLETYAGKLRDLFLILGLLVFAGGLVDVVMLAFNLSLGTGIMLRMGFAPHSIDAGAVFLILTSIAFGLIELNRSSK
jgi:uncharacterized protein YpmS